MAGLAGRPDPLSYAKGSTRGSLLGYASSATMNAETQCFCAVIAIPQLAVKIMYVVFAVLMIRLVCEHTQGMEGGVAVSPKLEPLDSTDPLNFSKTVGAALKVGPNNVDVIKSD